MLPLCLYPAFVYVTARPRAGVFGDATPIMKLPAADSLVLATCFIALTTLRGRLHPLAAILLATAGFAVTAGLSMSQLGKSFGTGFGQAANNAGLPVLAAAMVAAMAHRGGATARGRTTLLAGLGLAAGTGALPAASFAVLAPLRTPIGNRTRRAALTLGFAISAGQACLLPSPVLIAATAILSAQWTRVLAFGLPLAILAAATGALLATRLPAGEPEPQPIEPRNSRLAVPGVAVACLVMALMLVVQSLGDIPSEPLGGGAARELLLGIGRPLIVLLAGVFIMAAATRAWRHGGLSENGWVTQSVTDAAPLILLLAASGGLQSLVQSTNMAELLAEQLLSLPIGLALPFLLAATLKIAQGSSLAAAITAAGMMQTLLPAAGLDGDTGRTLAVLAIGAGAVTGTHVNDPFFWLVADGARLRPAGALAWVTGGTIVQGFVVVAALIVIKEAFLF